MPDEARRVVVNATPIIGLALVHHLDLLRHLYQEVLIPESVRVEVLAGGWQRAGAAQLEQAPWIRAVALQDPRRADLLFDLDRGEAEVIALAQELGADLVILDDRLGRRYAKRLGLALTGTMGVLLKAKQEGLISAIKPLVEGMLKGGFRLATPLVARVLDLAGE